MTIIRKLNMFHNLHSILQLTVWLIHLTYNKWIADWFHFVKICLNYEFKCFFSQMGNWMIYYYIWNNCSKILSARRKKHIFPFHVLHVDWWWCANGGQYKSYGTGYFGPRKVTGNLIVRNGLKIDFRILTEKFLLFTN